MPTRPRISGRHWPLVLLALLATIGNAAAQAPDLITTAVTIPSTVTTQQTVTFDWTVENQGTAATTSGGWFDEFFISTTPDPSGSIGGLGAVHHVGDLAAGTSSTSTRTVTISGGLAPGNYYLVVYADWFANVGESNENNNFLAVPLTVLKPDLVTTAITVDSSVTVGETTSLDWTIANQGTGATMVGSWFEEFFLSTTPDPSGNVAGFQGQFHNGDISAGDDFMATRSITIPNVAPGNYYVVVYTDWFTAVSESNEGNNFLAVPITVLKADLITTSITFPSPVTTGQSITLGWTVMNQGNGDTLSGGWFDEFFLSTTTDTSGNVGGFGAVQHTGDLAAGASSTSSRSVTIPNVAAGNYYVLVYADWFSAVPESNENNNLLAVPITIQVPVCGDGAVTGNEQCDDGNTVDGDCCSSTCQFEASGSTCTSDVNACTDDRCNGAGACLHSNNTAPCNDGVFCNGADTCSGGSCSQHAGNPCVGGPQCANACNEASDNCFVAAGTACLSDGNPCTLDQCNGAGACAHPAGNAGTVCRAAAGQCDVAESCDGTSTSCPPDQYQPDHTSCDDGNTCTSNDFCLGGTCSHTFATPCDPCEVCDPDQGCMLPTNPGCEQAAPARSSVKVKEIAGDPTHNQLVWKWIGASSVPPFDFGDPTQSGVDYTVCLIDNRGNHPTLLTSATAPGGSLCGTAPCWKLAATQTSAKYKNKLLMPDGLGSLAVKSGGPLHGTIKAKGKGALLDLPTLTLTPPVTLRLQRADLSRCWEATYSTPLVNTSTQFKGKSD